MRTEGRRGLATAGQRHRSTRPDNATPRRRCRRPIGQEAPETCRHILRRGCRMPAGDSAGAEARRQLALADAHAAAAVEARATAARYSLADVTEKRTAQVLAPLTAVGHFLLADRAWPGSRRAQVDVVVAGPGGVFIVDTKAWKDVTIHDDRIHRGQEDVTDDILNLADLAYTAEGDLAEVGRAAGDLRGRRPDQRGGGPGRAARGHPGQPDRGVDELPAPLAGQARAAQLQRAVAHPRACGDGQDRRRAA